MEPRALIEPIWYIYSQVHNKRAWYLYCEWYHHKCPYVLDATLDQLLSLLQKNLRTPPMSIAIRNIDSKFAQ